MKNFHSVQIGQNLYGTVGSPFYIAPEVLAGGYNQAADVWSAGVILYILLSGMPPFWGKTKSRIFDAVRAADLRFPSNPWDSVTESAKELVRGMLCTDPSQRLTAQQVLGRLDACLFISWKSLHILLLRVICFVFWWAYGTLHHLQIFFLVDEFIYVLIGFYQKSWNIFDMDIAMILLQFFFLCLNCNITFAVGWC